MTKTTNVAELNEKFRDCSTETNEYEINGVKYRVISHFTGTKDVDEVIFKLALEKAMDETLKK